MRTTQAARWGGKGILGLAALLVSTGVSPADDNPAPPLEAKAAFEAMKALAGTWQVEEAPAQDATATIVYKVVGNGSALVEDMFPGSDHAMVSVYHLDGDELVMTHYCAAGNQPHLKLDRSDSTAKTLKFDYAGGTNLDPVKDAHMHEGQLTWLEDGRVKSSWTGYAEGKPSGTHEFTLKRAE